MNIYMDQDDNEIFYFSLYQEWQAEKKLDEEECY